MGSNIIRTLLTERSDVEVINFDKLTYAGNLQNLKDLEQHPRYAFVRGDIANERDVENVCQKGVDVIINYAAETHVDRSILDPKAFLMTDILGTYTLLEAVRKFHIPKMIQISTDEVFGSTAEGAFDETSPFEPNSPYSASKAGADHLCRAFVQTYDTPVIVTHSCNVYGPYQYPEKIIPLFITNLLEDKKVPVYGDGQQTREWIFTEDHCHAILTILEHGAPGEVYNIGSGERKTNLEVTRVLLSGLGKDESMIERIADRPGHDRRYAVNSAKLRKHLGWSPLVPFEQGLQQTIDWYRQHEDWWKPLKSGDYLEYYQKQYHRS